MAVQGRHVRCIQWAWAVLSFCVVLEAWRVQGQIATEGPSSPSCREEYLIAVENKTEGIVVSVLDKHSKAVLEYPVRGHYLSSQCGDHYLRCQNLLVMPSISTTEGNQYIVFVPLIDGVLLLRFSYDGKYTDRHIIEIDIGCSPTAIFEILENVIVVCLNQETGYLATVRIYPNVSAIKDSRVGNLQPLDFHGLADPPHLSNFKYVNSDNSDIQNSQWILFASSNYVYTYLPLSNEMGPSNILGNCSIPESLVYVPEDVLLVYCHDSAVYFNLAYEYAINQTRYSKHGQPFVCPNPDVHVAVFASASYIQYSRWSDKSRENFNIHDMKFDSGVCFGSKTHTLFAYNDKKSGVYILDTAASDSNLINLSSKPCLDSQCEPLMVFKNRYIVVREREKFDSNVIVVDSQQNYQAVITAEHVKADLLTLLIEENFTSCSLSPGSDSSLSPSTPTISPPVYRMNVVGPVVGSIAGFLMLVLVCSTFIVIIVCRKYIHRKNDSNHGQETSDAESRSSVLQNDSESDGQQMENNTAVEDVGNESMRANPCLNEESPGAPAFGGLSETKQVYPSLGCYPVVTAEDQPVTDDHPHTQESSDQNSSNTTATGDFTTSGETSGATATTSLEQASGSQQASICTSAVHSGRESSEISNKPPHTAFSFSASASYVDENGDENEWATVAKSEEGKTREYESSDQLIPGNVRAVPQRKSLHAVKQKLRRKRAERGDYENYGYQNLVEQIIMEDLAKD